MESLTTAEALELEGPFQLKIFYEVKIRSCLQQKSDFEKGLLQRAAAMVAK